MKSSPNVEISPATDANATKTLNTSGKKLVQARLPFKTLSDAAAAKSLESTTAENNRKRKLSATPTVDDGLRAPKCHRKENIVKNDSNVQKDDLLTSETLDSSVEFSLTEVENNRNKNNKPDTNSNDCRASVPIKQDANINKKNDDSEKESFVECELLNGEADDNVIEDDEMENTQSPKSAPKAKKCLDMSEDSKSIRKSKRSKDSNLIMIRLPLSRKAKEAKKSKKDEAHDKSDISLKDVESSDNNEISDSEKNVETEKFDSNKSFFTNQTVNLNDSILTNEDAEDENDDKDSTIKTNGKEKAGTSGVKEVSSFNESIASSSSSTATNEHDKTRTPVGQKLTPKQLQRKAESEKKLLEKQRAKEERDRKAQEAKELRQKEKEEKEEQKKKEREEKEEQKRREREEKEEQRKREKEEREMKRQAEIDEREKKRLQEIEAKNEERRKKEEQKEEERRKREEQKEEERKKREEQKEEERLKKEEEKRQKDEAEKNKMRKTAEAFAKFFLPKKVDAKMDVDTVENINSNDQAQKFMSFAVKGNMKLAPIKRRTLTTAERGALDNLLFSNAGKPNLYLNSLKEGKHVPGKSGKTWNGEDEESSSEDDDIYIIDKFGCQATLIEEKPKKEIHKAKFFKFHENRRPPFYGTWRKASSVLSPRNPLAKDTKFFDYEVDSDLEWEEEEPGESLHGSEDEKDQESEDEYDIDNEFFVPHGHLSDEEICKEDDIDEDNSPETQKAKLKFIQREFDEEHNKKMGKLKPRVIGLIWQNPDKSKPSNCSDGIWKLVQGRAFMLEGQCVNLIPTPADPDDLDSDQSDNPNKKSTVKRIKITEDAIPDLIKLINGNQNNCDFLIKEFRAFMAKKDESKWKLREFSIISIRNKIRELAEYKMCPEIGVMQRKMCWYVPAEKRKAYGLEQMSIPFNWSYTLTPRRVLEKEKEKVDKEKEKERKRSYDIEVVDLADSEDSLGLSEYVTSETVKQASLKQSNCNIAKFIRVLSQEEKRKNFGLKSSPAFATASTSGDGASGSKTVSKSQGPKKRVNLLLSVPCGQTISPKLKDSLVTQYINNNTKKRKLSNNGSSATSTAGTSGGQIVDSNVIQID